MNTNMAYEASTSTETQVVPMESPASRSLLGLALPSFRRMLSGARMEVKPHQLVGVHWLLQAERAHCWSGGLLADDMGLGKTIMLLGLAAEHKKSHTLVVVPLALLDQWREQVLRLTGKAPLVFHGPSAKRITREQLDDASIVLATYRGVGGRRRKRSPEEPASRTPSSGPARRAFICSNLSMLHSLSWDRVIYDEAHHLRNRNTAQYIGASYLRTEHTWLVTGTPMQNSKADLKALADLAGVSRGTLVGERMLRRTKDQAGVALPPIASSKDGVAWKTREEMQLVEKVHSLYDKFHTKSSHSSSAISFRDADADASKPPSGEHLVLLTRCRQACVLPQLLTKSIKYSIHHGATAEERHTEQKFYTRAFSSSSRLDHVADHILHHPAPENEHGREKDTLHGLRRKIVFCNYRGEMDFLYKKLTTTPYHGMRVGVVDGRTSVKARREHMQNSDVLLLQIQTSCEGLNLQHFQDVYFVSPHWNPFVEKQAVARCHRIGQTREVRVFRFFMAETAPRPDSIRPGREAQKTEEDSHGPVLMDNYIMDAQDRKALMATELGVADM